MRQKYGQHFLVDKNVITQIVDAGLLLRAQNVVEIGPGKGALTSAVAVAVMCLLPNAGSFGMSVSVALIFGLFALMLLDTSLNMAMQPFKMMVGDMVNERQKGKAYSIQSFLCNAGSVVGFVFPFLFTWIGLKNVAPEGVVPDSVIWSFYIGAAILILCVLYTTSKVKEWPPQEYNEYNPAPSQGEDKANWFALLKKAPADFWRVSLVQFFCWAAFLYMWTYVTDAVSLTVWDTADSNSEAYQTAGNWTGILYAVQAVASVCWAMEISQFKNMKQAYSISLLLGGIGFALIPFCHNQYLMFLPFMLIGCAWAAMLACPFTFVTNALQGYGHMGAYLGLFNCAICLPQIVAAATGGFIFSLLGSTQTAMMYAAGFLLAMGAICVFGIKGDRRQ